MMRAFYIISLVFSLILIIVAALYAQEVSHQRIMSLYNSFNSYDSYNSYSSYGSSRETTQQAAIISTIFVLFFTAVQILSILKIKTKTMKVLGIIGTTLSGILIIIGLLVIAEPGSLSYDESGGFWVLYALIMLAFSIVGTIHAFRTSS